MIARIEARVAEGKAVIFLTTALMRASRKIGMKISACIRLKDRIVDVKEGASPANVKIKAGGGIKKQSTISNIKTSDFMVELGYISGILENFIPGRLSS